MRLENVAEMGYYHTDKWHGPPPGPGGGGGIPCLGRGEICYRGPCVFKGYYKLADKTSETIDEDVSVCSSPTRGSLFVKPCAFASRF